MPLARHTLGHALLLQRLGNPLAGRPQETLQTVPAGDLLQALMVCTRPWESALRMIDTRWERWWMAWNLRRIAQRGPEKAAEDLHAYRLAAWPKIEWWTQSDGKMRTLGADLLQILVGYQRRTGLTLQQALDVPMAVAHWDAAAEAERSGAITIRSERDQTLADHYDRLNALGALPKPGTVIGRN
jgi:hypothetical protein